MTPFRPAHIIQLRQGITQAAVQEFSKPFLLFLRLRHGGGHAGNHSWQPQERDYVHVCCRSRLLPQRFGSFQIGLHQFFIHLNRRGFSRLHSNGYFHVSTVNLLSHDLPRDISSICVPLSRISPSSKTRILSARRMVARRCAMTKVVRPTMRLASAFCTNISDSASNSEVASSRIRMGESFKMARAMAMRCRCPPLKRVPRSPITVS